MAIEGGFCVPSAGVQEAIPNGRRGKRVRLAGVEGEMTQHLTDLFPGQSVVHRAVQVIGDLRDLSGRDESPAVMYWTRLGVI